MKKKMLKISTHAPAGGATGTQVALCDAQYQFLLTPLREGRPWWEKATPCGQNFYSRPCGRGDKVRSSGRRWTCGFLLTPLREGRLLTEIGYIKGGIISTHAPAGGATGIFFALFSK